MKSRNLLWGIFFIIAGLTIILNQTGVFYITATSTLLISVALFPIIIKSVIAKNFFGIFFSLAIYAILFSEPLGLQKFTPWPVIGTALFLSIGFTMIFPHKHKHKNHNHIEEDGPEHWKEKGAVIESSESEVVYVKSHWGGTVKYITSQNLNSVEVDGSFSGTKVYLDNAKLENGRAVINFSLNFAGVDLYVPKEWRIIDDLRSTFGGCEEKGLRNYETGENTIVLKGNIKFSGISIIRV